MILHVINSLDRGGAEMLLKNTLPLLEEYQHIVCYLGGPEELKDSFSAYPVYCLHHKSHLNIPRSIWRLRKLIKENNVSIVHAHLYYSTLLARLACPRSVKFVFTIHNLLSKDAFEVNRLALWAEKLTYKNRHTIIGVSAEVIKDYNATVGVTEKTFVLYNYIEDKYFSVLYSSREDTTDHFRLIAVGNLRRQKNYENLLKAFTLLKSYPVSLDIYGSGDLAETLQTYINKEQIAVTLKGRVGDVSAVLQQYDAYIMSSLFEGYGIAPMEAMAAGMPVLLSDIAVFREVAGENPVYFNPTDPKSIAAAIQGAYQDREKLIQRSADNRAMIRAKASKEIYKQKLTSIYQAVLTGN